MFNHHPVSLPQTRKQIRFGRGPDAGLYLIGVIAVLAFISMIAVLFWVASRENSAHVAALPTATPLPGTEASVVLLPIVSGKSTSEAQDGLNPQGENSPESTPLPAADLTATSDAISAQAPPPTSGNTLLQSPESTSAGQDNRTPSGSGSGRTATPSPTTSTTRTQTVTATTTNQTPTPTMTGEVTTLFIRNDQGCVDPQHLRLVYLR